ncbi:MAG: winged helix-turn-helix transcriptional regulator [Thermoplasmata archaeon]|nr:MAG: winged helix-turn-helix transcriptional regulator [Thermoplasmata archaeon]
MKVYQKIGLICAIMIFLLGLFGIPQARINASGDGKEAPKNPFNTYYSNPCYITDMVLDSENNKFYIGCEYGLIVKNLDSRDFKVINYFDGIDSNHVLALEADFENSRIFILVKDSNHIFILNTDVLQITEKLNIGPSRFWEYDYRFEHILYESEKNRIFLGGKNGLCVVDVSSNGFEFYGVTFFDLNNSYHFSIFGINYNENTKELYLATSEGLTVFNTISREFINHRNESDLAGMAYDVIYVSKLDTIFLGCKEGFKEYNLDEDLVSSYPLIYNPELDWGYTKVCSFGALFYDSNLNTLYAFGFHEKGSFGRLLRFNLAESERPYEWIHDYTGDNQSTLTVFEYDQTKEIMYVGLGYNPTGRRLGGALGAIVFSYDPRSDTFTPINVTNHIEIDDQLNEIEVHQKTGDVYIVDRGSHQLICAYPNGTVIETTYPFIIYDIEIKGDSLYLLSKDQLKEMDLISGEITNMTDYNITSYPILDISRDSNSFYIGTEYGIIVYEIDTDNSTLYPLSAPFNPPNVFGIAVDEKREVVYFAHRRELYLLHLENGTFEMTEDRNSTLYNHFGEIEIHYNSNSVIINQETITAQFQDIEGFPKTGTFSSMHLDQDSNRLYAVNGMHSTGYGSIADSPPDGLHIYDFELKTIQSYYMENGLPSGELTGVAVDSVKHRIHITGERFYTVVDEDELARNITRREIPAVSFAEAPESRFIRTETCFILAGIGGLLSFFTILSEPSKFRLISIFAIPLFTRLKKDEVMDNETRGRIRGHIESDPGIHYNELKKKLKLKNGSLSYHLQVLEREGFIKSKNNGIYKHFFPAEIKLPPKIIRMTDVQKIILKKIRENPGISQNKIAESMGGSSSTVNYNINILAKKGIVDLKRVGKKTECYVIEGE